MYIQRTIHPAIRKYLQRKEYTIITGPRQCGKTSLLQALFRELYPEYSLEIISYEPGEDCRWVLKV